MVWYGVCGKVLIVGIEKWPLLRTYDPMAVQNVAGEGGREQGVGKLLQLSIRGQSGEMGEIEAVCWLLLHDRLLFCRTQACEYGRLTVMTRRIHSSPESEALVTSIKPSLS